jgi:Zn-dependent peptidase ImmA (M78 family)/DNA-binding XRE family transcriptional regulator
MSKKHEPADSEEEARPKTPGMVPREQQEVNTEALIIARELAGMTQTELSRASGLSQTKISRFEDGISDPDTEDATLVARFTGVPLRFLYRRDVKRSIFNSFYRKRKSISQRAIMQFNSKVCFRQIQIDRLLSKVEMDADPIPRFDLESYPGGIEGIAAQLRQLLKIPPGPIKMLMRRLEDAGVVIVFEDLGMTKIDGVSTFTNHGTPLIVLNSQAPNSRRRFSLAHEVAHTALHKYVAPDADEQADALAAEFLMPADEISPDIAARPITLGRLADLKLKWRVSMGAILYRAKKLNIIDQRRYTYMWTQMSAAGYRIREPHEELLENEKPTLEKELLRYHREDLSYSASDLSDALDISEEELAKRTGEECGLRVV